MTLATFALWYLVLVGLPGGLVAFYRLARDYG